MALADALGKFEGDVALQPSQILASDQADYHIALADATAAA
jgi:hypothetical protein